MQAALAPHPAGAMPHGNLRAIFAQRGFRRLLAVRVSSQLGDGWFQAGLASSVLFNPERAATPAAIATAFAILLVPYSTLGPFVGVFLDRWSRRTALVSANTIRAVLVLPASLYVWRGEEGPLFLVSALAIIALNRFFLSGLSASQPHVVEEERLVTANSIATTFGTVVFTLGIGSAGLIFHLTGTGYHPYAVVSATAALAYAFSALLTIWSFQVDELGPDDSQQPQGSILAALGDTARGMVDGVRHLVERPSAASLLVVQAAHRTLYGILAITVLLLYRNYYTVDNAAASMSGLLPVAAVAAVGSLLAAVITPPITRRVGGWRWVTVMLGGLALLVPALGLPYLSGLTAAAAFFVSLVTQGTKIVTDTALQVEMSDEYRGRVFSINDTAFNLMFVVGLIIGAVLLPADGHSPAVMATIGLGYAITAIWYGMVAARLPVETTRAAAISADPAAAPTPSGRQPPPND
jgi:MFS family permease